ncbi:MULTISPECIES: PTS sugar transporter subunit IIA [Gracilibacillus]|uniref:PTS sugar transporter subunit IIA n=1 Tax=Gracilibacillus TaxID=74385 RepID=UPI00082643A6|nr:MULTISPECIES: PTS glucose transporter subunit IIA [Gracilibacillus]
MLGNLFKKKETNMEVVSPMTGDVVTLEDVPDQVFSQKMMGEGIAIAPVNGEVVAPIDGEVVDVFRTKHAISLHANNGAEILIHMGLETVELDGKGFEIHVTNGQKVKKGDDLASFDLESVTTDGYKTITPLIVLNSKEFELTDYVSEQQVQAGQTPLFQLDKQ